MAADPIKGVRRYEAAIKSRPLFTLAAKDSSVQLSGEYIDAATGAAVRLDTLRGKIVLVDVWTSWCMACRLELPDVKAFVERTKGTPGFVFLSVCGDSVVGGKSGMEIARFAKENGFRYPVLLDVPENSLIQRWHVYGFPTKLLFDGGGRLLRGANDHFTLVEADAFLQNNRPEK